MKYLLKITEHPVISTLLTSLILWLVGTFWIPEKLNYIYSLTKSLLFFKVAVPLIVLILLGIVLTGAVILVTFFYISRLRDPEWLEYTSDVFMNIRWNWRYYSDGQLNTDSLRAYCPKDETPLVAERVSHNYKNRLVCETCGFASDEFGEGRDELLSKISRQIEREVRTKYQGKK